MFCHRRSSLFEGSRWIGVACLFFVASGGTTSWAQEPQADVPENPVPKKDSPEETGAEKVAEEGADAAEPEEAGAESPEKPDDPEAGLPKKDGETDFEGATTLLGSGMEISIPEEFLQDEPSPLGEEPLAGIEELEEDGGRPEGEAAGDDPITTGALEAGGLKNPSIELRTDAFGYIHPAPDAGDDFLARGDLEIQFEGYLGSSFLYSVSPRFRIDSGDNTVNAFEFLERKARRPVATFHEAYLGWVSERFEVSVGKKVFNWGVSDAYNPVDDLNPRDLLEVPTSDRIGMPALSVYYLGDSFEIESVWEPFFAPSRIPLPGMDNRWLGDFGGILDSLSSELGYPVGFDFAGRDLPPTRFENGQGGVRLSSSSLVDGWDLALTGFRGRQSAGVFRGDFVGDAIISRLEFPRYTEVGGSFSTVVGSWQIHGEGSWHATDVEEMDDDYLEYVAGVNRTFSDVAIPFVDEVILTLEYAGQEITRSIPDGSPYFGSGQFARPFGDAAVGTATLKLSEETEVEVGGSFDFADSGSYFQASLAQEINEHLELKVGADIFSGPQNSFFGKWGANDRIFLTLTLTY